MLSHYLQKALEDLKYLIMFSEKDIDDLKDAKQEPHFDRMELKEEKLKSFEQKKAMIDHEISKLMRAKPGKDLPELLDNEQYHYLEDLKIELSHLRKVNQVYARMVLGVSAFYNALLERVVRTEIKGYNKAASNNASSSF